MIVGGLRLGEAAGSQGRGEAWFRVARTIEVVEWSWFVFEICRFLIVISWRGKARGRAAMASGGAVLLFLSFMRGRRRRHWDLIAF